MNLEKIKTAWRKCTCRHMHRQTTVIGRDGVVETKTVCEDCGESVQPNGSFSGNILGLWLEWAKESDEPVIFYTSEHGVIVPPLPLSQWNAKRK